MDQLFKLSIDPVATAPGSETNLLVRVKRFELSEKLILSQPPLPIGLHAQVDLNWYSREDSNPDESGFELPMSAGLHHASKCIADFRLPIANLLF